MATRKPIGDWEQKLRTELEGLDPRYFLGLLNGLEKSNPISSEFKSRYPSPLFDEQIERFVRAEMERRFRLLVEPFRGPGVPMFFLYGGNFVSHLKMQSSVQDNTFSYFRYGSKLYRAIEEHICYARDCVLIARPGKVVMHRGSSGVSFKHAHLYADNWVNDPKDKGQFPRQIPKPATVYNLQIEVEYVPAGVRDIYGDDDDRPVKRSKFYIQVPIDLELNFTKAGFDAWVEDLQKKRDKDAGRQKDLEKLRKLVGQYPKETKEMLTG
jgi:hypothetical protein